MKMGDKIRAYKVVYVGVLANIVVVVALLYGYHELFGTRIKVVDFDTIIQSEQGAYVRGERTREQFQARFEQYLTWIKRQPRNTVVLNSKAVVSGAAYIDETPLPNEMRPTVLQTEQKNTR